MQHNKVLSNSVLMLKASLVTVAVPVVSWVTVVVPVVSWVTGVVPVVSWVTVVVPTVSCVTGDVPLVSCILGHCCCSSGVLCPGSLLLFQWSPVYQFTVVVKVVYCVLDHCCCSRGLLCTSSLLLFQWSMCPALGDLCVTCYHRMDPEHYLSPEATTKIRGAWWKTRLQHYLEMLD